MTVRTFKSRVLKLRPPLRFFLLGPDRSLLVGGGEYYLQRRPEVIAVLSLIDGLRTEMDIVRDALRNVHDLRVLEILNILEQKGWVVEDATYWDETSAVFGGRPGADAARRGDRLCENSVFLISQFADPKKKERQAALFEDAFLRLGISVGSSPDACPPGGIQIMLTDNFIEIDLDSYYPKFGRRGGRICFVQPTGKNPMFIPLIRHGHGPCPACIRYRLGINRPVEAYLRRRGFGGFAESSFLFEPAARVIYELAAVHIAKSLRRDASSLDEGFMLTSVEVSSMTVSRHAVQQRPQCPVCGNPELMRERGERPVVLREAIKVCTDDGGYRLLYPEEAFEKYASLISPITGAVSQVDPAPGGYAHARPVFISGYRAVPRGEDIDRFSFQRVCAGKGRRPEQAKMSALAEAVERFSGTYQGDEACLRASQEQIGEAAYPPSVLLNYSERQYANRERHNQKETSPSRRIPLPYDSGTPIDWTPAWSLTCNERRYVPLSYCFAETPPGRGGEFCPHNGNGAAAGTCIEEAILQGVLETVERDAAAVWWYNRIPCLSVDFFSLQLPYFDRLKTEYHRRGYKLWVLDLTHDLKIPVFAAVCCSSARNRFSIGFGCHLDPRLAVQRALSELNQLFDPDGELRAPWEMGPSDSTHFLFPSGLTAAAFDFVPPKFKDIRDDISYCIERLREAGMELIVADKTRPDIGLSVVHVIVPGLRHFRPRLGPGRLYSVPKKMGRLPRENTEDEMNPVPLWL